MKQTIFAVAALACAAGGMAEPVTLDTANTLGVMKISSDLAYTIVSQPYETIGGGTMKVTDFVITTGLQAGDRLYYFTKADENDTRGTLNCWQLAEKDGKLEWQAATTTEESTGDETPENASSDATQTSAPEIAQGSAVVVYRQKPTYTEAGEGYKSGDPIPFYVYGQVAAVPSTTTTVTPGRNLLAYPLAKKLVLNDVLVATDGNAPARGDIVEVLAADGGSKLKFTYTKSNETDVSCKWYYTTVDWSAGFKLVYNDNCEIPAGQGFWYVRKTGDGIGSYTINWAGSSN